MSNSDSDRIKEAPAIEDPETAVFTDAGITDENIHFFTDLLNQIEDRPDAARSLNRAYAALKSIAGDGIDDLYMETEKAALELAEAFATIEKWKDYIPAGIYNDIGDTLEKFYSLAQWQSSPDALRSVLPHILRRAILRDWEETPV